MIDKLRLHLVTPKFQAFVTAWCQCVYAIGIEFWVLWSEPLWNNLFNLSVGVETATIKMLPERAEKVVIIGC
jgi:hypothetical protein